jgi:hypothetical protein
MVDFGSKHIQFDRIRSNWPGVYLMWGQFMSEADASMEAGDAVPRVVAPHLAITWDDPGVYKVRPDIAPGHIVGVFCGCGANDATAPTLEVDDIANADGTCVVTLKLLAEDAVSGIKAESDDADIPCWFVIVCSDQQAPGGLDSLLTAPPGG